MVVLAATDPANPYGALLRWPAPPDAGSSLTRSVGARVILADGALAAYLRRGNPNVQIFFPEEEPALSQLMHFLARYFVIMARRGNGDGSGEERSTQTMRGGMFIQSINGIAVAEHPMARALLDVGFQPAPMGFNLRHNVAPIINSTKTERSHA
jgi:ATP-dependent Lhr-like helicase